MLCACGSDPKGLSRYHKSSLDYQIEMPVAQPRLHGSGTQLCVVEFAMAVSFAAFEILALPVLVSSFGTDMVATLSLAAIVR